MALTNNMIDRARRLHTLYTLRNKIDAVNATETDLSGKTKSQIVEFGSSIGVSLSMSLSKASMISTLKATDEWSVYEAKRKALDPLS
jgi:multimeric flavodoxin WrbA